MPYDTRSHPEPHAAAPREPATEPPALVEPPRGTLLDRLARWLEGGGRGTDVAVAIDLANVLRDADLAKLPRLVVELYATPTHFRVTCGFDADRWTRALLAVAGAVTRQMNVADRVRGFEAYPTGQLVYRDRKGRTHWDRYAWVDGRWRRLFIARASEVDRCFVETFTIYGLPVPLTFRASVEGDSLVLRLQRRLSSPLSWIADVEYRTGVEPEGSGDEVRTRGRFRVPLVRFDASTEFRARPLGA